MPTEVEQMSDTIGGCTCYACTLHPLTSLAHSDPAFSKLLAIVLIKVLIFAILFERFALALDLYYPL